MILTLIETIVKKLVDSPEDVKITEVAGPERKTIQVHVAAKDLGRVIGSEGRVFKALRSMIMALDSNNRDLVVDSAE